MKKRETVVVEFAKHELPITDRDIKLRMMRLLELARSEKILSLTITTRSYMTREQRFLFEGIATIESTESNVPEPTILCGQPGGPKTVRSGWWQKGQPSRTSI